MYFKKEYRQELEKLGIKPKLRENSPVLIRSALKHLAFTKLNNSIMISKLSSQFKIDFTWEQPDAAWYLKKNPEITYAIHWVCFDGFAISSLNSELEPEARRFYSNSEFLSILLEIQKKDCKDILKNIQEYKFGRQEYFENTIELIEQQQDFDKLSIIKQALEDTLKSVRLINVVNITKYWKLNIGISIAIAAALVTLSIFFPPIGFFLAGVTITNTIIGIIGSLAFLGSFLICTAISAIVQNNQKTIDGNALLEEMNELRKNTTSYDGSIAKIFTFAPSTIIHDTHGSTDALESTIIPDHTGDEKEEEEKNMGSSPKPPYKTI